MKHYIELDKDEGIIIDINERGEFVFQLHKFADKDGLKSVPTPISQPEVSDIKLVFEALQIARKDNHNDMKEGVGDYIRNIIEKGYKVAITYEMDTIRYSLYTSDDMLLVVKLARLNLLEKFVTNINTTNI